MNTFFAGLSALFYGIADFSGGFASKKGKLLEVLLISQISGIFLGILFLFAEKSSFPVGMDLLFSFLAGIFGLLGLLFLYKGLATGIIGIVSPSSAFVAAIIPLFFGWMQGERPSSIAIGGIACCIPAVILLSFESDSNQKRENNISSFLYGLTSGIGFAGFFIMISKIQTGCGFWPIVISKTTATFLIILCIIFYKPVKFNPVIYPYAIFSGFSDMGANIFFILSTRQGFLSLSAIISSLFPAPTVLLARIILKEKIPAGRIFGILLSIFGIALISAG